MPYPQDAGLSSLMANYGNISQGMNPGQQPSFGGNPFFPGMSGMGQTPSYQPQDWGGFAPGQLNAQYGTGNTYGTQNGMVNYGYGQQPVVDYAKQVADQQAKTAADQAAADELAKAKAAQGAQNVYAPNPMTGGQAPGRYDAQLDGARAPAMSPTAAAIWAQEHPILALPGQYISDMGVRLGLPNAQVYADAYRGIVPKLNEAGIENGNPLAGGPLDSGYRGKTFDTQAPTNVAQEAAQTSGRADKSDSDAIGGYYVNGQFNQPVGYAYGGITSLLR